MADFEWMNRPVVYADPDGPGESMTKQSFSEETDVNAIMRKYLSTGQLPPAREGGRFGDFTTGDDFLQCQLKVKQAEEAFMMLDANVRDRFDNDPAKLLDFVFSKSPENREEAIKLGLIMQPEVASDPVADGIKSAMRDIKAVSDAMRIKRMIAEADAKASEKA